jgi:predicted AlkP superfamily pyrophosphatase or phosphodiesterase
MFDTSVPQYTIVYFKMDYIPQTKAEYEDDIIKWLGVFVLKKCLIISLVFLLSACQFGDLARDGVQPFKEEKVESQFPHKKVIMVIIDSMTGSLVDSSIRKGTVPALQFLIDNGQYYKEVVAPFPTMSVTIESSIVTGEMPDKHEIPGLSWYNPLEDRIVNYGTSSMYWLKSGVSEGVKDALYHLNNTHLSKNVTTIFEELDQRNLSSGAVNTLVYRGNQKHYMSLPGWLGGMEGMPDSMEIKGPNVLAFGSFATPEIIKKDNFKDGVFSRFGLNDQYTMEVTQALIKQGDQPDFLMAFMPEFDEKAHDNSIHYRKGFEEVDQYLQGVLNAFDSWEEALDQNIFIIVGDHGQDNMVEGDENVAIDLDQMYADYHIPDVSGPVSHGEIAFGVNQRMTYVYDVHHQGLLPQLAERARSDQRVAVAAWWDGEWVNVIDPDHQGMLRFKPDGGWSDRYDQTWSIEGDRDILDLKMDNEKHRVSYTDYPDGLNQLYSALHSHDVPSLILAANPGYVFQSEGIPTHPGGADHGGFHRNDSLAVMVIAGTDQKPKFLRMVDLKDYVLKLLTESPERKTFELQANKQNEQGKKQDKKQAQKQPKIDKDTSQEVKQLVNSIDGVTESVAVTLDQDIYVSFQVTQWHRLKLKNMRKQAFDLLRSRFADHKIHVSPDWKIHWELKKLDRKIKEEKMVPKELDKRLKKLEEAMKG